MPQKSCAGNTPKINGSRKLCHRRPSLEKTLHPRQQAVNAGGMGGNRLRVVAQTRGDLHNRAGCGRTRLKQRERLLRAYGARNGNVMRHIAEAIQVALQKALRNAAQSLRGGLRFRFRSAPY